MNALSKVILVTASLHSLTIVSMEPTSTHTKSTNLVIEYKESLTNLYSLTQYVLSNSDSLGHINSSFNEKPTHKLLAIIAETNELKKKHITEEHIAQIAYKKETSLFERDTSFLEKFEEFVSNNHKSSNYHIAVFFERLKRYNNNLLKNNFATPTFDNYKDYIANKSIENQFKRAIKKASSFGILLDETMIHTDKQPFTPIAMNIATEELDKLINDIKTMCSKNTPLIKGLADLLFLNNQENETIPATSENKDKQTT